MIRLARMLLAACALLAAAPALAKQPLGPGERIDLNRASTAQLMRLPGVGRKKAQAIVAYRAHHPFRTPSDLLKVKGVKRPWFERMKGHLATGAVAAANAPSDAARRAPGRSLPRVTPRPAS